LNSKTKRLITSFIPSLGLALTLLGVLISPNPDIDRVTMARVTAPHALLAADNHYLAANSAPIDGGIDTEVPTNNDGDVSVTVVQSEAESSKMAQK
jgi:hypothetical protein